MKTIKLEPGCTERNIWGQKETGRRLCKDCGATYESHCVCNATKKKRFIMIVDKEKENV